MFSCDSISPFFLNVSLGFPFPRKFGFSDAAVGFVVAAVAAAAAAAAASSVVDDLPTERTFSLEKE